MREVVYKGKGADLGRFGAVKPGDVLALRESEWDTVKGSAEFVPKDASRREDGPVGGVMPYGTAGFDLRTIAWEKPNLSRMLLARFKKRRLLVVAECMRFVGAAVRDVSMRDRRVDVVDAVVEAMRRVGWDRMSPAERWALPSVTEPPRKLESPSLDSALETADSSALGEVPGVAAASPPRRSRRRKH